MTASGFDHAFQAVQRLAAEYRANYKFFISSEYSEAETRKDFIDKLFIALGWDVNHDEQKNPFEQEVKVERRVSTASGQRHADYAFHVAPNFRDPRLLVEAKKPYGDLETADNYFQAVRYGWNKQTPLAGLTDFKHFHLLDCRYEPDIETALNRSLEKWSLADYFDRDKFSRLYWLISREAVASGSLDKFADSLPRPRRGAKQRGLFTGAYLSIDESFLKTLDAYRTSLARAFKSRNHDLDSETLTEATQRTLDRLVFMRFLEDKLIEPSHFVANFGEHGTAWEDFVGASRRLDRIYNGIVFKKHDILDAPDFRIDDPVFSGICEGLSHKNSPYDFNSIPIHILGSIYERFLGNVIVATDKRVRVEPKPEVRKAGGVYYTPDYIVRYIVENTVGKMIEGKTPDELEQMRFADIACGSGSFLLSVYDLLLRYHEKYYNAHPRKARKGEFISRGGVLHLSVEKKRDILLNNIYGVDIDPQAVEVTQLSLYLKLLDEETIASTHDYQLKLHAAILPSLNKNIVCGNSLVDNDMLRGRLLSSDDERELNPMSFKHRFPQVMKAGGFDCIVGNPPYVRSINMKEMHPLFWDIYRSHYRAASAREWDIYLIFVEKGLSLLNPQGRLGYILPNKFLNSRVGENVRAIVSDGEHLDRLVHFGAFQVFPGVTTYTCLLFLSRAATNRVVIDRYVGSVKDAGAQCPLPERATELWSSSRSIAAVVSSGPWDFTTSNGPLLEKLKQYPRLEHIAHVFQGTGTRADKVYLVEDRGKSGNLVRVYSHCTKAEYDLEPIFLKRALRGRNIDRYELTGAKLLLIAPYQIVDGRNVLVPQVRLAELAPRTLAYLRECKPRLDTREKGRFKGEGWYGYGRPQNLDRFEVPEKIVLPDVADRGACFLDREGRWLLDTAYAIRPTTNVPLDLRFVIGILNSPLLTYFLKETGSALRGGYFRMKTAYLNPFPIPSVDLSKASDKAWHDQLVSMVDQIGETKIRLAKAKTDKDKNYYEAKCVGLDQEIDSLVYQLYVLTDDEIGIVKNARARETSAPVGETTVGGERRSKRAEKRPGTSKERQRTLRDG